MKLKLRLVAAVTTVFVPITFAGGVTAEQKLPVSLNRSDAAAQGVIRP